MLLTFLQFERIGMTEFKLLCLKTVCSICQSRP